MLMLFVGVSCFSVCLLIFFFVCSVCILGEGVVAVGVCFFVLGQIIAMDWRRTRRRRDCMYLVCFVFELFSPEKNSNWHLCQES